METFKKASSGLGCWDMKRFILCAFFFFLEEPGRKFAQDFHCWAKLIDELIHSPWEAPQGGESTREALSCDMSVSAQEHLRASCDLWVFPVYLDAAIPWVSEDSPSTCPVGFPSHLVATPWSEQLRVSVHSDDFVRLNFYTWIGIFLRVYSLSECLKEKA